MHRARLSLLPCLITLVVVSTASALPSPPPADEPQAFEARFIEPAVGFGIKERKGQLVIDAAARVIRFERDTRVLFTVGADDIVATHYGSTARAGQRPAEGRHYIALFWSAPGARTSDTRGANEH